MGEDLSRRAETGVPGEIAFANKIELAERMIQSVFVADAPARWMVADSFYD